MSDPNTRTITKEELAAEKAEKEAARQKAVTERSTAMGACTDILNKLPQADALSVVKSLQELYRRR